MERRYFFIYVQELDCSLRKAGGSFSSFLSDCFMAVSITSYEVISFARYKKAM